MTSALHVGPETVGRIEREAEDAKQSAAGVNLVAAVHGNIATSVRDARADVTRAAQKLAEAATELAHLIAFEALSNAMNGKDGK